MQILHLDSSILGDASVSRALGAAIVDELVLRTPSAHVVRHDLVEEAIAHLDGPIAAGFRELGVAAHGDTVANEHARSERLVRELLASDVIVIGAPMYNFSVASQLKAWIDRVVQPGRTFRYTAAGPVGLAGGRRVIIASTRGGFYTAGPMAALDFQEAYLRAVLGFMGITQVQVVRAEGQSKGPDVRAEGWETAHAAISAAVDATVAV